MTVLSTEQLEDLRELRAACTAQVTTAVIIGAVAYRLFIDAADRLTHDIDLAVALDLEGFAALAERLTKMGWRQVEQREHRWRSVRGTLLDLLPVGASLRAEKRITWPRSQCSMSLLGFRQVFCHSVEVELAPGLTLQVAPPPVLALLKMAAYLDDPHTRTKDLADVRELWQRYLRDSDRLFSDEVFEAELPDIELAGTFLLGLDLRPLCTPEEIALVRSFLERAGSLDNHVDFEVRSMQPLHQYAAAFAKGFEWGQREAPGRG